MSNGTDTMRLPPETEIALRDEKGQGAVNMYSFTMHVNNRTDYMIDTIQVAHHCDDTTEILNDSSLSPDSNSKAVTCDSYHLSIDYYLGQFVMNHTVYQFHCWCNASSGVGWVAIILHKENYDVAYGDGSGCGTKSYNYDTKSALASKPVEPRCAQSPER